MAMRERSKLFPERSVEAYVKMAGMLLQEARTATPGETQQITVPLDDELRTLDEVWRYCSQPWPPFVELAPDTLKHCDVSILATTPVEATINFEVHEHVAGLSNIVPPHLRLV